MDENKFLAERFEANRTHLRSVAYRMLGSRAEAEDAVQEAWLRLSRLGTDGVDNLGGWMTTVVARVCLDMLRSRKSRREEPLMEHLADPAAGNEGQVDLEQDAELADSVGFGYTRAGGADHLLRTYQEMVEALMQPGPVQGFCYTQLTDVEQERNGLLSFDRRPKIEPELIREVTQTPKDEGGTD